MTKDEHIAVLQRLADEAREAGDYTAAVEATIGIGMVLGFYEAVPDATTRAVLELIRQRIEEEAPVPRLDS